jgi:hypothetical protein
MLNLFKKYNNYTNFYNNKPVLTNDFVGNRHFPPTNKEWLNSIYVFNKNNLKSLPIRDKIILRLLKSYFNIYSLKLEKLTKPIVTSVVKKRLSTKRPYLSRAELKHTNTKIIITMYIYNSEYEFIQDKIKTIKKIRINKFLRLFLLKKEKDSKEISNKLRNLPLKSLKKERVKREKIILKIKTKKELINLKNIWIERIKRIRKEGNDLINIWKKNLMKEVYSKEQKKSLKNKKLIGFFKKIKYEAIVKQKYKLYLKKSLQKELLYIYYKRIIDLYKFKFQDMSLLHLSNIIYKIYNKKIEFNFVNLKYFYLNSDIIMQILTTKLKKSLRKKSLWKILKSIIKSIKIRPAKKFYFNLDTHNKMLLLNRSKDLTLTSLKDKINVRKDMLDQILSKIFSYNKKKEKNLASDFEKKKVLSFIKYKKIIGIRLEARGRLTKRLTASRSVFKNIHKGGLKNIDSSFKNISSVMLRGYLKSNLEYTKISSKVRNGSFGLKGWLNSK